MMETLLSPNILPWIMGGGIMTGLLLIWAALADSSAKERRRRIARIRQSAACGNGQDGGQETEEISLRRTARYSDNPVLDRLIRRLLPRPEKLRNRLSAAGLRIGLGAYLLLCLILAVLAAIAIILFAGLPVFPSLLLGITIGSGLPHMIVGMLQKMRREKFITQFPEAIDLMVRGIKSGLPITETVNTVAQEIPAPVGEEFARVADLVRMGRKLDEALWEISRRLNIPEFKFFTVSLAIQSETGGNLAETLANLGDVLRKRRQMKGKIKALAAEPKMSATIIGALPFVMVGILYTVNPGYMSTLFTDPRGQMLVALGLAWMAFGAFIMFKMTRFEI